jgi:hypothetical protein
LIALSAVDMPESSGGMPETGSLLSKLVVREAAFDHRLGLSMVTFLAAQRSEI